MFIFICLALFVTGLSTYSLCVVAKQSDIQMDHLLELEQMKQVSENKDKSDINA